MKNSTTVILMMLLITFVIEMKAQSFPKSWAGKWSGPVDIWSSGKKVDSFPMSLEISPMDTSWKFIISYDRDPNKPDIRNYSLITIDRSTGHYAIDENNSIILDAYFYDNCLFINFGGFGSQLLTRICKNEEILHYEISSVKSDPVRVSGGEVINGDTIPEISSHGVYNLMKAKLRVQP